MIDREKYGLEPYNPRYPTEEEWNRLVENGRKAWGYKPTKWDYRFLDMARLVASWSKDPSTKVGAVIVDDKNRIVSLGYNGPPRGVEDDPSIDRDKKLKRTIHAETNAVLFARDSLSGTSLYVTHHPCGPCAAIIAQAGIRRVFIPGTGPKLSEAWEDHMREALWIFDQAGVELQEVGYEQRYQADHY